MPDWRRIVEERMTDLQLPIDTRGEVLAEIVDHLEDCYDGLLSSGVKEEEAERRTLERIENYNALQSGILRERGGMMSTFGKQFTLPSALALGVAMISLALEMRFGPRPAVWLLSYPGSFVIYKIWPVALLLAGGMAGWLSMRAGASRTCQMLAAISPALYMMGAMLLVVITVVFMNLVGRLPFQPIYPMAFVVALANWVVLPLTALWLGALPFLGRTPSYNVITES